MGGSQLGTRATRTRRAQTTVMPRVPSPPQDRRDDGSASRETAVLRILLVDEHTVVYEGLAATLSERDDMELVGWVRTPAEAFPAVVARRPGLVLTEAWPRGENGIALCGDLLAKFGGLRVGIFTRMASRALAVQALAAGASTFLVKTCPPAVLYEALTAVSSGRVFVDPVVAVNLPEPVTGEIQAIGPYGLTRQQRIVIGMLPRGLTNLEIGKELGIAEETVKTHLRLAMRKLGTKSRAEAAAVAQREGFA